MIILDAYVMTDNNEENRQGLFSMVANSIDGIATRLEKTFTDILGVEYNMEKPILFNCNQSLENINAQKKQQEQSIANI